MIKSFALSEYLIIPIANFQGIVTLLSRKESG